MQYVVHTSGEVLNRREKAYVIKAPSKEKAREIAKEQFSEDFLVIDGDIDIRPYRRTCRAIMAYIFMLIPIGLSFVNWKVDHETESMRPDSISCLYAILLYSAFIIRFKGIQRTVGSWIDIGFCIITVLLISSFIQTLLVTKTFNIFWIKEISINTNIVLPVAILLSWLGLKVVSAVCMAGVGLLAIFNIASLSEAMGSVYGPIYIICAFMGILFYLSIEPMVVEHWPYFKKSVKHGANYMKRDFVEAGNSVKKISYTEMRDSTIDQAEQEQRRREMDLFQDSRNCIGDKNEYGK